MQKYKASVMAIFALLALFLMWAVLLVHNQRNQAPASVLPPLCTLTLRENTFTTAIAKTPREQERGLSLHPPLALNEGMLFVFPTTGKRGFWMKDMLFPLDIIWLDSDLRVISYYENLTPDSYPTLYDSPATMRYALEVNAGTVKSKGVISGDTIMRDSNCNF